MPVRLIVVTVCYKYKYSFEIFPRKKIFLKKEIVLGVVAYTCKVFTQELRQEDCYGYDASMAYTVSSRYSKTT